ncbi:MAG: response regulator [Pontiella sp.]
MYIYASIALASILAVLVPVLYWNRKLRLKAGQQSRLYAGSKKRILQIFENSPDAIFIVEENGKIVEANTCACNTVKLSKNELLTKSIGDISPKAINSEVDSNLKQLFSGEMVQCESALMDLNHTVIPVEMLGRVQEVDQRKILQLHVRDISLRKKAEDKIHAARQMAEESSQMANQALKLAMRSSQSKSEFLAGMSRDLRMPLNDIIGMGQLLSDSQSKSEQGHCINIIQQSSVSLLKIINNVLDIAKIESGQMNIHPESFDIRKLCESLQQRFQQQADCSGINLSCQCLDGVPPYLVGDEGLIEQVLVVLLTNALKFTPFGTVTLNVECLSKSASGAGIYFQVIDTGIGVSDEKQATIFTTFIQTEDSAKYRYSEAGLGLAICKRQVELMGGLMGLSSSEGEGSTFYFNLSLPQAEKPLSDNAQEIVVLRKGIRVLLAEDNPVNQTVASALLVKAGCLVDAVGNGRDAVLQIRKKEYDVVLMDCEMPVMDGFETTKKIRSMREPLCRIPIIALTANAMKDDHKKCIDGGMNDYISKPINREKLIKLINHHAVNV